MPTFLCPGPEASVDVKAGKIHETAMLQGFKVGFTSAISNILLLKH